ncbi:MAG TPA: histidine phosphatase family protein [Steroidobacteraceae bacterium]|nr:histidine phosphatase family protein [Steroidobacteraceae bacterium]
MATPEIYLIRHGETEWSLAGKHTGVSDIPLTEHGRQQARLLRQELVATNFERVLTSPLRRARETCELAGLAERAEIDPDLMEWNYGGYEGLTSEQIHVDRPGWTIFNDGGGPGGETPEQVGVRVDRVIARVRAVSGDVILFAHGHVLRVLAARWLGLAPSAGAHFLLDTATLCVLSSHGGIPAFKRWNVAPRS